MELRLIHSTPILAIYHDASNDWLFVDWEGELTLVRVKEACTALASCYLARPYTRVLTSNMNVTGVAWDAPAWLAKVFLPYLSKSGVEQLAWVCGPTLRCRDVAEEVALRQPLLALALFDDLDLAVHWLQQLHPDYTASGILPQRPPVGQAQVEVRTTFTQKIGKMQPFSQSNYPLFFS